MYVTGRYPVTNADGIIMYILSWIKHSKRIGVNDGQAVQHTRVKGLDIYPIKCTQDFKTDTNKYLRQNL